MSPVSRAVSAAPATSAKSHPNATKHNLPEPVQRQPRQGDDNAMTSKAHRNGDSALKVLRKWVRDSYMGIV